MTYRLPGQPTGVHERHVRRLFFDTVEDLDALNAYQRRVNELALDAYVQASERISRTARWDEGYDGGDLHDDAIAEAGLDPNDVVLHTGMMSLSRAVTLLDNVIAQAPTFLVSDERRAELDQYIYPNGQLWDTELADSFYWNCLTKRMRPWGGDLKAIRELRNLYEHGYGYPRSPAGAEALASKVHRVVRGGTSADESETALGLHGAPEMFQHGISYTPKSGIQADVWQTLRFAIDPLATHRLIKVIRERSIEVIESVSHGFSKSIEDPDNRFYKDHARKTERRTTTYAHPMDQIATAANISRDGSPGGSTDFWKLTLYSDTGYVVDAVALSTRDRKANPLEEATAVLRDRKYEIGEWVQSAGDVWNAEIQQPRA